MKITGVLIPFDAEHESVSMKDLAKEVTDKLGYVTDVVLMDGETYDDLCVEKEQ